MNRTAQAALQHRLQALRRDGVQQVRVGWCDLHGSLRGKTLVLGGIDDASALTAVTDSLAAGIGMVGTVLLKDSGDRTALPVFQDAAGPAAGLVAGLFDEAAQGLLARLSGAANVLLQIDPDSLCRLPWAPDTAWLRAQARFADGSPVSLDTRAALQRALAALADAGFALTVGIELEFHVYRITDDGLGIEQAGWPAAAPAVRHLHAGHQLLGEAAADQAHEVLAIVRHTALGLGLPLRSLEIELGPSQFEAVFGTLDALAAADAVVLFRNGVRQALRRAGLHASFACKPPLAHAVASGWHLHQSLRHVDAGHGGGNAFMRAAPAADVEPGDARAALSDTGAHWLAGLRAHAAGMAALCVPSLAGYGRFQGGVMAPQRAVWGFDNRGAMLRVLGRIGDAATRIENRIAEPMANPYLALASQVWAGLDGVQRRLAPGPASDSPYAWSARPDATDAADLPSSLHQALQALAADRVLQDGLGADLAAVFDCVKRHEIARHAAADDPADWLAREYFARF
jgi:glutamine synthetase